MNAIKRSTMQYSPAKSPARKVMHLQQRVDNAAQAKANLSTWEGEGGAVETPAPAVLKK